MQLLKRPLSALGYVRAIPTAFPGPSFLSFPQGVPETCMEGVRLKGLLSLPHDRQCSSPPRYRVHHVLFGPGAWGG